MERSKAGKKKWSPQGLNYIAQAYLHPGSLRPETVDKFPNESTRIVHPLSPGGGENINKHNMVIFNIRHGKSVMKYR